MYLFIYEFDTLTQSPVIADDDIEALEDGCLQIFRFNDSKFEELIHKDHWVAIEEGL